MLSAAAERKITFSLAFLIGLVSAGIMRQIDPDLWGHLFFGKVFWKEGFFILDPFSYTASHHLWIDHEWLWEVIMAKVNALWGMAGVFFAKALVLALTFRVLFLLTGIHSTHLSARLLVFSVSALTVGHFGLARPQIFTYLFFSIMLLLFYKKKLFFLLLLFPLWANSHGGFMAGLIFLLLLILGASWEKRVALSKGLLFWLLCALSTLINPYGWVLHKKIVAAFLNPLTHQLILEWQPPKLFGHLFFTLLVCLTVVTFLLSKRRRGWEEGILFIGFLLAVSSIRHIPLFAIFLTLTLPPHLATLPWRSATKLSLYAILLSLSLLLFPTQLSLTYPQGDYPKQAIQKLKDLPLQGNLCTPFGWGEFALYFLYPKWKVCIDGRYDTVYPLSVIRENFDLFGTMTRLHYPMLTQADCILSPHEKAVTKYLRKKPFPILFEDKHQVLFCREQSLALKS